MKTVVLNHRVKDFSEWKKVYDSDLARRDEAGLKEIHVGTRSDDPTMVYIVFQTNDISKFQGMVKSPDLEKVMKQAGVVSTPEFIVIQ